MMKRFISSIGGKICIALLVIAAIAGGAYGYWHYQQPKFHDVTMELGEALPEITAFLTEYANPQKAVLTTPTDRIDLTLVGEQTLNFKHGSKEETVTLTIVDTTAPTAVFRDVSADIDDVLTPQDFVEEAFDLSGVTISFVQPLTPPDSYGDVKVEIRVTDAHGNAITGQCSVFYVWMYPSYTMELGDTVEKADLLLDPVKDDALLDQALLDEINAAPAGTYTITSIDGDQTCICTVTVQDTTAPELTLKNVKVYAGESVKKRDFIVSATDLSGEVTTTLLTEPDTSKKGKQTIVIEAVDVNGNKTTAEATLEVITDTTAPTFSGVGDLTVEKHSSPDFKKGVRAKDNRDGTVDFTYDAGKVNLDAAGTYYVTYTATDKAGNKATYRRKVVVNHDAEDTAALVDDVAAGLSSDPEAIRDYVRDSIRYSTSWGGDDPVWYGFKNKVGNCYVHALCLQALLREKGYTTQLIWCTDKTHYWNLIYLNGQWMHIDATPGTRHTKYSLMNDEQRYETLSGRDWDRSAWPACE